MPPDKTWRERHRPRLIIDLEGRPESGRIGRSEKHSAVLVINSYELKELTDAVEDFLLDRFHTLVESERVNERKAASALSV